MSMTKEKEGIAKKIIRNNMFKIVKKKYIFYRTHSVLNKLVEN